MALTGGTILQPKSSLFKPTRASMATPCTSTMPLHELFSWIMYVRFAAQVGLDGGCVVELGAYCVGVVKLYVLAA